MHAMEKMPLNTKDMAKIVISKFSGKNYFCQVIIIAVMRKGRFILCKNIFLHSVKCDSSPYITHALSTAASTISHITLWPHNGNRSLTIEPGINLDRVR